jgi:hypothetical protein
VKELVVSADPPSSGNASGEAHGSGAVVVGDIGASSRLSGVAAKVSAEANGA